MRSIICGTYQEEIKLCFDPRWGYVYKEKKIRFSAITTHIITSAAKTIPAAIATATTFIAGALITGLIHYAAQLPKQMTARSMCS